ncbi:hypothetical protein [Curvibacter gracilis]|uniref:hypothetical protein n=1 Tax=Curvibacter gracilis TaxID=230310 RepID=UPI000483812B|nr:hypothetical protein [Curvibacter gracilis]
MIGDQKTGRIENVVFSTVTAGGLPVTVGGRPAKLAVIADDGQVVAMGDTVAREAQSVAVNFYRSFLKGKGYLRTWGNPIPTDRPPN